MNKLHLLILLLCGGYTFATPPTTNTGLIINIENYTAIPGESFCLEVSVENFSQIVSSQYTLVWNAEIMQFDSLINVNLPYPQNFFYNENFVDIGQLLVNWFDSLGEGNDLDDGTVIYELCFTAVGAISDLDTIGFENLPVQIEVTDVPGGGQNIGLCPFGGMVSIAPPIIVETLLIEDGECTNSTGGAISLNAVGGVAPLTYAWSGPNNFMASTLSISDLESGDYFLTITDSSDPALTTVEQFTIGGNFALPSVEIAPTEDIDCNNNSVTLNGEVSTASGDFNFEWNTLDGNIIAFENTLMPVIDQGGTYELQVTDIENGCSNTTTIFVEEDLTTPQVAIADAIDLDCNITTIQLIGSGSDTGTNPSYLWTTGDGNIVSGENSLVAVIDDGGTYELLITNEENGCTSFASMTVEMDTMSPVVDAGGDQFLLCPNDPVALDGSNSSSGANYEYSWSSSDGNIISATDVLQIQVDAAGTYDLAITNLDNGCSASASATVEANPDLAVANAGMDINSCSDILTLDADLPDANTGMWTGDANIFLVSPTQPDSEVNGLENGQNILVWTLSTEDCPNYSADTVVIGLEDAPLATDDQFLIPFASNTTTLDVVANDDLMAVSDWEISAFSQPGTGQVELLADGSFSYSYTGNFVGEVQFAYELCNTFCPSECDEGIVTLLLEREILIDTTVTVPNGITPNGDQVNDYFVIPILEERPEDFPNSEMIIFNRWGDIVYQAQPYLNDWGGTNEAGKELPQGTYYYVLRLDLNAGEILKGDVTIIK